MTTSTPSAPQAKVGTELILATKPFAKDHSLKSWWVILSTLVVLAAAYAGAVAPLPFAARLACSVLAGLTLVRFFVIYHDQQHHAILPRSFLAEALMRVFGILALSPSSVWRSSHNHHHNHNSKLRGSHIGSYPIMTTDQYKRSSPRKRFAYLLVRHPITILFGYWSMFLHGMCINPFLTHPIRHLDCLLAIVVHLGIGVALYLTGGWTLLILVQLIPHFVMDGLGAYLFYAQHNFPTVSFADKDGWTYEKAALESSSFMRTGKILGWFTANIGYHHIHHLNARIPFYRLPEVLAAIPELQEPKTTSLWPTEIARCLRLKVWDVETQRMVGVRGL